MTGTVLASSLVISLDDPHARRHGGTLRTRAIVEAVDRLSAHTDLVFPGLDEALASDAASADAGLRGRVHDVKRRYLPLPTQAAGRDRAMRRRVDEVDPQLVVVSVLSQAQLARRSTAAHRWVDFMDVWSDFARREALHRRGPARLTARLQARWLRGVETRTCSAAGIVTAAGWTDAENLRKRGVPAVWLPTPLPDGEFAHVERAPGEGHVAGFLANFSFWPNRDAYEKLIRHWMGPLAAHGWTVLVAGHGSQDLPKVDGVQYLGEVDDVNAFYGRVDATLAPIEMGGGMKVKVLESVSRGRPVIGTAFALEGFPPEFRRVVLETSLAKPDMSKLGALEPIDPQSSALTAYRMGSFEIAVRDLISGAVGG